MCTCTSKNFCFFKVHVHVTIPVRNIPLKAAEITKQSVKVESTRAVGQFTEWEDDTGGT